ncbi:GNAT family N-acetyltransferase [Robertmurraya kyonggiensis]|uniref:GNAT family N-acetyltransferase n=1 Tax=Robertmurraya kyonggiensis TaxID=1037680 RepID=A0A4U1DC92_9BACI|nr:GNAT family protein [Robertmurraya kyonggiensis]TKC20134.1 GNAT family N-acetyltransferase [Robertmurraya kyonggiensis]
MLQGKRINLRPLTLADAERLLDLQIINRVFFEQFSMIRTEDYYTIAKQRELIEEWEQSVERDEEYRFGVFLDENLIGTINLFQVIRGSLQSAFIGYFLDQKHNGKGYMTEAVQLLVEYAFSELKLHRIEAGVMPHNIGSIRVLEKSGFHKEGIARKNVKINNRWEDHQVLAIINPNDE